MISLDRKTVVIAIAIICNVAGAASAQDAQYWTNQYGARADLLGGAVVGSLLDLSDTYYNPGALALLTKPSLLIGTEAFGISTVTLKDGAGEGIDLRSLQGRFTPGFFAGAFTFEGLKDHRLAYSVLTRYRYDFNVDGRQITTSDAILDTSGEEYVAGEIVLNSRVDEGWMGLSWAYPLADNLGFGITQYVAGRSQRSRFQNVVQAVADTGEGAAAIIWDEFKYWNVRLLWKAGLSVDYTPITLGFTVTTPSVNLFGNGSSNVNASLIVPDIDGDGIPDSELASNYQDKLDARYESPLSIAAGAAYSYKKTGVHVSVEWFDAVDEFKVLDPAEFQMQSTGETFSPDITQQLRSITNFGVGVEHTFHDKLIVYGSFKTDRSAYTPGSLTSISTWDIYHIQAGSSFKIRNLEFTLGMGFGFGSDTVVRITDFQGANDDNGFQGEPTQKTVTYRRLRFILGFSFPL